MTSRLDQMNPIDAAYDRARRFPGGIEALAPLLGCASKTLYNKFERATDSHHLRFEEWEQTIARCAAAGVTDAYAPLRALAYRFGHVAIQLPDFEGTLARELAQMVVQVFKEGGDVARLVDECLANDECVTAAELRRLEPEIEQAIAALVELRERARRAVTRPRAVKVA